MSEWGKYPENRLDIRMDENGNISYEQNRVFAQYYAPTREEMEEELEDLEYQLDMLELDRPDFGLEEEYDEWRIRMDNLKERIRELEEELEKTDPE